MTETDKGDPDLIMNKESLSAACPPWPASRLPLLMNYIIYNYGLTENKDPHPWIWLGSVSASSMPFHTPVETVS